MSSHVSPLPEATIISVGPKYWCVEHIRAEASPRTEPGTWRTLESKLGAILRRGDHPQSIPLKAGLKGYL